MEYWSNRKRSVGVLECWSNASDQDSITPSLHHSIIPLPPWPSKI
jgi:hypothetical protein